MTDFIAELEAELLAAARRRAAHGRRRWRAPRLRPARIAFAAAVAVIVALVVTGVRALDGPPPANERPAPVGTAPFALPQAVPATECADAAEPAPGTPDTLAVFLRERSERDRTRSLPAVPADWIYPDAARRPNLPADVRLIPVTGLRSDCPAGAGEPGGDGVCLTVDELVRCFANATIESGRAVASTGPGRVHGIAPDGVSRVRIEWSAGAAEVRVVDNAYEARHPGLHAGETVTVRFLRPDSEGCAPSQAMYDAVPVLRGGSGGSQPEALAEAMTEAGARGEWRRYAHLVAAAGDLDIWVVPNLPCDNAREQVERVCLVPVLGDRVGGFACHRPAHVSVRGAWMVFRDGDRVRIAGIAPAASGGVTVSSRGGLSESLEITGGVFGAILPEGFETGDVEVRFVDGPPVVLLNGTRIDGLATELAGRIPGEEDVENHVDQQVERTTVYYAYEDARGLAEHVAATLRVSDVRPAPSDVIELVEDTGIVVVVGRDMAQVRPEDVGLLDATDGVPPDALMAIRDGILPGAELATAATGERRTKSWVRYAPGWGRPARQVMRALGLGVGEQAGDTTPEPALGTPIVVVIGDDLAARFD